jgi:signal transduction histidine kinase
MLHPILRHRQRLGLYLVVWLFLGTLMAFAVVGQELTLWGGALLLILPPMLLYSFVCLASWYPCQANPVPETPAPRLLVAHLVAAVLSSGLLLLAGQVWISVFSRFEEFGELAGLFRSRALFFFAAGVLVYLLAAALHYLLLAFEVSRRAESRALELRAVAREAELAAFRTQIDPHFIFNCLNSISSLCGTDPEAARQAAIRLGEFLRASLKLAANKTIPLSEEQHLAAAYLDVERVRFGDRLTYQDQLSPECLKHDVPALMLQPLLENALKHGIAHLVEGGTVKIAAEVDGENMRLEVVNPCDPDRPRVTSMGIGLANVRNRLRLLYDGRASITTRDLGDSFHVEIVLPVAHE